MNQKDISQKLQIPIGTVKSRLFSAKKNFKRKYPYQPKVRGESNMNDKKFPEIMPDIKINKSKRNIPNVNFEELPGWFIIPRIGENISWAMYDYPQRKLNEVTDCKVIGKAEIHGVPCMEIDCGNRTLYARLTDTHCQYIADIHFHNDVKVMTSFLDDDWLKNWSYGEDNCGREILLNKENPMVEGIYDVIIGKKSYVTLKVIDKNTGGIYSETYIDQNGYTVLWRRYNRNDWKVGKDNYYKKLWSESLPQNEKLIIDGETYVHWNDCITENVL